MVSTDSLHAWALDLDIKLRRGPRSPKSRVKPSPKELADAIEALLAAVVLDAEGAGADGFALAYKIVKKRFGKMVSAAGSVDWELDDPKTALQEKAAVLGLPAPVYELIEKIGPDHAPVFLCSVRLDKHEASGRGNTLKRAQTEAARVLLHRISATATG
jgi:ribonuclease-3